MGSHQITLIPISEVARISKNFLPASISNGYSLKSLFRNIADDADVRNSVVAFRDFLHVFFDRLISDGHSYAIPPKIPNSMTDYPFLYNITNLLVDMGYCGKLADDGKSLFISEMPLCTATIDENGKKKSPKIPISSQMDCLRFLSLCGFEFNGVDLDGKSLSFSTEHLIEMKYPKNPETLLGLKVLSIADMELRTDRRYWNDHNLLRCDYRLLQEYEPDMRDVLLDFLHPLPKKIQAFALKLHNRYVEKGLTCINTRLGIISFAYVHIGKSKKALAERSTYQKRIWEFSYSPKDGYCIFVRPKKADKYADVIKGFPNTLQDRITKGYGCYKKQGLPRCNNECQGIKLPLDETILPMAADIQRWIDCEVPSK